MLLIQVGDAPGPPPGQTRLSHIGIKVGDSLDELRTAKRELEQAGIAIDGMSDHTVSQSLCSLPGSGMATRWNCMSMRTRRSGKYPDAVVRRSNRWCFSAEGQIHAVPFCRNSRLEMGTFFAAMCFSVMQPRAGRLITCSRASDVRFMTCISGTRQGKGVCGHENSQSTRRRCMEEPVIAAKQPAVLELEAGTYYWCRCGARKATILRWISQGNQLHAHGV